MTCFIGTYSSTFGTTIFLWYQNYTLFAVIKMEHRIRLTEKELQLILEEIICINPLVVIYSAILAMVMLTIVSYDLFKSRRKTKI